MVAPTPIAAARPRRVSPAIAPAERSIGKLVEIPLELIDVGPNIRVDAGELEDLAQSIRELGVLQPIRAIGPNAAGRYRAVWGQRRILASRIAQQATIPSLVEPSADVDQEGPRRAIEQLVENIQRADLGPIDEAYALQRVLAADKTVTQADLARRLGRSPSWLANALGLLDSPKPVQEAIAAGQLTASHAKALKGLAPTTQAELARRAVDRGSSAHTLERDVQEYKRNEEWRKEQESRSRVAAIKLRGGWTDRIKSVERKVPKDAAIHVVGYSHVAEVADLFRTFGWTNVKQGTRGVVTKPAGVGCDCKAWKVEPGYSSTLTIVPGCTVAAHAQAKTNAEEAARLAKGKVERDVRARLASALPAATVDQPPSPAVMRILLWELLDYGIADWAEKRGFKRSQGWAAIVACPDADLASELGSAIGRQFRDQNGYHVPWPEVEAQLGLTAAVTVRTTCPFPSCIADADHPGGHDIVESDGPA